MHAEMEVNCVLMQFTLVSGHGTSSKKQKKNKFKPNYFANVVSD